MRARRASAHAYAHRQANHILNVAPLIQTGQQVVHHHRRLRQPRRRRGRAVHRSDPLTFLALRYAAPRPAPPCRAARHATRRGRPWPAAGPHAAVPHIPRVPTSPPTHLQRPARATRPHSRAPPAGLDPRRASARTDVSYTRSGNARGSGLSASPTAGSASKRNEIASNTRRQSAIGILGKVPRRGSLQTLTFWSEII